jgi:acyl-CoA synthetase (AMP-forming)/AMP-acid ligase II
MIVTDGRRQPTIAATGSRTPHTMTVVVAAPQSGQLEGKVVLDFDRLMRTSSGSDAKPANASIDIDLAALIYTSGSTGRPKGVMLTHLNIVSAADSITTYLENSARDVILNVLPMSFDYGLYQVLMAFKVGATIVLERSFAFPHAVLEKIATEHVTAFPIVPTMSAQLLRMDLQKYDFAGLRYITNTAASWPLQHIRDLRRLLPDVKLYSMYGLTECKRVSYLPPDEVDTRPESVGRGMPNQEVYVVDSDGNRLAHGVGELVIRGSHVMKGYWEMPEETAQMLRPGEAPGERVLYSGDLFRIDEDGYLYFLGRMDDMIKTRGEKVSPREVENVLYELTGVVEAAVVGVPDPVLGQSIKAVLTLEESASLGEQDVLRHCAERLESFMVPKIVEFRASLPKTATGKIDKKTLHLALAN